MTYTDTPLSTDISRENLRIQYDRSVKRILAHKPILARILQYTVKEVAGYTPDEIQNFINQEDLTIGTVAVNPGLSNMKIVPKDREDDVPAEGIIFYDVRFSITLPDGERQKIIINVEAQRKSNPGYSLVNRGIFYDARLISSQLSVEFTNDGSDSRQYDNLKKVYSIWICMNCPMDKQNSIVSYNLQEEIIYQDNPRLNIDYSYDLINVTLIHLSGSPDGSKNELIAMLDTLLGHMDTKKKKQQLEEKFHLPMTREIKQEVEDMCNLSAGIWEDAMNTGIQTGLEKGRSEGRIAGLEEGQRQGRIIGKLEGKLETLKMLVTIGKLALADAAQAANMSPEEFKAAANM